MVKRISALAAVLLCVFMLCSCTASRSQIGAYVRGTAEECETQYQQYIRDEVEYFKMCMDIDEVSDATYQRMVKIFETLYAHCKYKVGEVTRSSDRFLVSVTVYPIDVISKAKENGIDDFEKSYGERARKGEFDKLSDSEREELWADGIITEVEKNLDNIGYLDPVTISLQVIIEDDGYSIVDDDLVRMDELVISY